ncbi:MAG: DNA mismatch repair endonuclease MutL [Lachnospiraceae bacterium]|nr:DNA mismatch repair endonuclease MutL [Lachnospiraceae bacterium]
MGIIQVLSQNTINQIAAGEVIERPASVVKELVENAIDAKASAVTVEIKEGGIDFIRITDNGTGIEKEDVRTAFLCHATSKIRTTDDLLSIGSLGFRGEALASIASVSKTEVITKTAEPMTGVRYVIEGGEEVSFEEVGCPEGTTFIIRNLFYNTPARRKFLKSKMTEAGYISTMMERIALSHPEVAIKLIHQNKAVISTSGSGRLKDVIYQIYGKDIAANLLPVSYHAETFSIEGYVGKPSISRGNRALENYFVNGRFIKNNIITKAIEDSYKTWQMVHKYPFTALNLTIEPELLDVNVHPAKMEVRFKNGEELFAAFMEAIKEALTSHTHVRKVSLDNKTAVLEKAPAQARGAEPFEKARMPVKKEESVGKPKQSGKESVFTEKIKVPRPVNSMEEMLKEESRYEVDKLFEQKPRIEQSKAEQPKTEGSKAEQPKTEQSKALQPKIEHSKEVKSKKELPWMEQEKPVKRETVPVEHIGSLAPILNVKAEEGKEVKMEQLTFLQDDIHTESTKQQFHIIGQLFDTYWLLQKNDELLVMDQHAAHEKVLYEKLLKAYREREVYKQQLMPPVVLNLTLKELDFVKTYESMFEDFGFTLEEFGSDAYCLRTIPSNLFGMDAQVFFRELLDAMEEEVRKFTLDMVIDKIATMACKAAIKANQKLTMKEAEELLKECEKLENPYTCPHGRPVIISISKREIEKKFKRIV